MHSSLLCFLVALVPLAADAASCSAGYGQCGGQNWSGATCCVDGFTCKATNDWYSQCVPGSSPTTTKPTPTTTQPTTTQPTPTTSSAPSTPTTTTSSPSTPTTTTSSPSTGNYLGYDSTVIAAHDHAAYPSGTCGSMPMDACMSGVWGEKTNVPANDAWHYSRSTHFGLTNGGACGFGLYGLCTKGSKTASWTDPMLGGMCDAFCKAYPVLCQDPTNTTMRGNYAAPNGNYYTQFWPHLKGDKDNYLSCGECFELVRTKPDGTDYQPGEKGYTDPVTLEIIDSCPCSANTKWCCGAAYDQCQEVSNWKYGCPIPKDSTHLDLSDIAMIRLQGNQDMPDGVIPTRYRRVACPKPGNLYIWLRDNGSPYYFALTVVNAGGVGSVSKIEVKGAGTSTWTELMQDPNYPIGHPQERYGSWTIPKGSGPFNTPVAMRITSPNGEQAVVEQAIKSFTPPASAPAGYYYIDLGIQFSAYGKH